jgi:FkbM family methyltransferase
MIIKYGTINNNIDVTNICLSKLTKDNIITIPSGNDNRAQYFNISFRNNNSKKIMILNDDKLTEYNDNCIIKINLNNNTIITISDDDIDNQLVAIQSKLKIQYGNFNEELPEQKMVVRFLTGNEKVLEIGGNIGRNSLIISNIINNNNLVVLESNKEIANQLKENRDLNNFNFHIENSALSTRKLIQKKWKTIASDVLLDGYSWVNIITFNELKNKYNIDFDTLILDCEGAFYFILHDMPDILKNINLIIMENDYHILSEKQYVDYILKKNNFIREYYEEGGWGPCRDNFYEVWRKS